MTGSVARSSIFRINSISESIDLVLIEKIVPDARAEIARS
jgi:hypothetical protein